MRRADIPDDDFPFPDKKIGAILALAAMYMIGVAVAFRISVITYDYYIGTLNFTFIASEGACIAYGIFSGLKKQDEDVKFIYRLVGGFFCMGVGVTLGAAAVDGDQALVPAMTQYRESRADCRTDSHSSCTRPHWSRRRAHHGVLAKSRQRQQPLLPRIERFADAEPPTSGPSHLN